MGAAESAAPTVQLRSVCAFFYAAPAPSPPETESRLVGRVEGGGSIFPRLVAAVARVLLPDDVELAGYVAVDPR
eukprot:COSAG02_NODE_1415_length_12734_cov_9.846775_6_plen_74_part_00